MATTTFTGPVVSLNGFVGASDTGVDLTLSGYIATPAVKAADGTASITLANSTGVVTFTKDITLSTHNLITDTTTGTKFGTAASQKLGFFNATPVIQQATTGTTTGFTAGSGTASKSDSTFTGNTGTAAYTVGDIVRALKNLGFLAA